VSDAGGPLILLVEDSEAIRRAFRFLLEDSGYRVVTAETGEEALRLAGSERPRLVLLDLGLPDLHGLEVTRRLKIDPATRDIPVVALTGRALESDRAACHEAGCAGFLVKPIEARVLLRELPGYLEG
jgi:CheY-like chemotaxis protein